VQTLQGELKWLIMKLIGTIFWVSLCVLAFLVAAIAVNQEKVSLSFLHWRTPFELSLFWWLFGIFLVGTLYGSSFGLFRRVKQTSEIKRLEKIITQLESRQPASKSETSDAETESTQIS
jgi:uncharacterized integral membrane protein